MIRVHAGESASPPPVATTVVARRSASNSAKRARPPRARRATGRAAGGRRQRPRARRGRAIQPVLRSPARNGSHIRPWPSGGSSAISRSAASGAGSRVRRRARRRRCRRWRGCRRGAAGGRRRGSPERGRGLGGAERSEHPQRAGGADHQRDPVLRDAAGADVRGGAVGPGREPRDAGERRPAPGELGAQAGERRVEVGQRRQAVGGETHRIGGESAGARSQRVLIEEPGPRGHRDAAAGSSPKRRRWRYSPGETQRPPRTCPARGWRSQGSRAGR